MSPLDRTKRKNIKKHPSPWKHTKCISEGKIMLICIYIHIYIHVVVETANLSI